LALHHDLLELAGHLAIRETKKPRQASLRRAVSTAYYALFHLLIADAVTRFMPARPIGLRLLAQRAFNHGDMYNVCLNFMTSQRTFLKSGLSSQTPSQAQKLLTFPLDLPLFAVMQAFNSLQSARHDADYNLNKPWNREKALDNVQTARRAFDYWSLARETPNATVFLTALLLQRHWGR
jgi:uncharacterized protein (UPF0332 family)